MKTFALFLQPACRLTAECSEGTAFKPPSAAVKESYASAIALAEDTVVYLNMAKRAHHINLGDYYHDGNPT